MISQLHLILFVGVVLFSVGTMTSVISGSGSIYVNAEDRISAVVSGSGSINYSGNPEVEQRVSGSGRVRKI